MQTATNLAVFFITNRRCLYDEYLEKDENITRANIQELCGYNNNQARRTIEKLKKRISCKTIEPVDMLIIN